MALGGMAIESPLDQQRSLVARMQAELDRQMLILEGMERMAAFSPVIVETIGAARAKVRAVGHASSTTSKGRQPGAISKKWRMNFAALIRRGNRFDDDMVVETVRKLEGRDMRRSEVRRLFENHQANGLVAFNDDGTYSVTQHAIDKFDLGRNDEGPADGSEGPSNGSVAERFIAPDYESGEVQGAGLPTNVPQASVGSNPTASAPITWPWETSTSPSAASSTPIPPWLVKKGG